MKKLKTLFLGLGLSALIFAAGCNSNTVNSTVLSKVGTDFDTLYMELVSTDVAKFAAIVEAEENYDKVSQDLESKDLEFESSEVYVAAIRSEIAAEDECGAPLSKAEMSQALVSGNADDGYKASAIVAYQNRKAYMNVEYAPDMTITDITFSPIYTMGESMTKAALNTLLGMGSVFCVLVLIMCIIYLFGIIPKIQKASADKKAAAQKVDTEKSVDKTIANIVEKEEGELVDDTELVAVISAAIAAYEGNSSTDGFVVRSIRKSQSKKWQNAQY